jgi:hypothetical protein
MAKRTYSVRRKAVFSGEEVDREDALGPGSQELAPGGTAATGRGTKTTCSQQAADLAG